MVSPNIPPGGKYPSRAELERNSSLGSIFSDVSGLAYDRRTKTGKVAGEVFNSDDAIATTWGDTQYQGAGQFYNPDRYGGTVGNVQDDESSAFVDGSLIDVPTSSTNYARPRTVAAAYSPNYEDPSKGVMTVVFRDGTFYNYYGVTPGEWESFQASYSKGRPWLNKRSTSGKPGAQAVDGLFIGKDRGPADPKSIPAAIREQLYRVARTQQIVSSRYMRPGKKTHSATSVYTGQATRAGVGIRQVAEPLQRAEYRKPTSTPGKNPSKNGHNPHRTRKAS
jgi:hypothetical protein